MRISDWSSDVCSSDLGLSPWLLGQLVPEERVVQRPHVRGLLVGGAGAVAAFGVLVVAHVLVGGEHPGRHLAGMAGVHAVVAGGGPDESRRVVMRGVEQLVRRERLDEFPVGGVRIAVLGHPRSRSEEHTSELQSLMRISYAVFCLTKKRKQNTQLVTT